MAPYKIVVVGAVNGQIEAVFQKIATLHVKNAFAFALIIGNLFADPDSATNDDHELVSRLVEGNLKVSLPTYFTLGTHALPAKVTFKLDSSAGEVCPNLYFLGKRTTTKTSEAIKIVSLGGSFDSALSGLSKYSYIPSYSNGDAKSLHGAHQADILVTGEWPEGIQKGSKVEFDSIQRPKAQQAVTDLCATLKPRYHFTSSDGAFYEREPFFHPSTEERSDIFEITRFISLAAFNNPNKQKWIYAFSLDPTSAPPVALPGGTTTSPLAPQAQKRSALPGQNSYRFSADQSYKGGSRPRKRQKQAPPGPAECFFCLSNPNIATHLITSIGNDSYLTTAKGPLSTSTTYPSLDFPAHILIIPLTHTPTISLIPDAESRSSTYKEMVLFRTALNNMIKKKSPDLGSVTWEVSRAEGIHIHWQFLPVPASLIRKKLVEAAFRVEAENERYPSFESREISKTEAEDYFRALVWDPETGKETSLVLPLDSSFRFDLQFGRRVIAKLLQLEGRAHWQDCGQTQEEEEKDVSRFKEAFKEFDFTLDE